MTRTTSPKSINTAQPEADIVEATMAKLETSQPESRGFSIFRVCIFVITLMVLLLIGIWLTASFILDAYRLQQLYADTSDIALGLAQNMLFELVIFAIVTVGVGYVLYRQTDWPLVRQQSGLFLALTALVIVFGGVGVAVAQTELFDGPVQTVEKLPYRGNRQRLITEKLKAENMYVGTITQIDTENSVVYITSPQGQVEEFYYTVQGRRNQIRVPKRFEVRVIIRYEEVDGKLYIKDIRPLPPKPTERPVLREISRNEQVLVL